VFFNLDFLELFILTFILTNMASIHKRENSRFWTASYTSRDGRQLKKSTKTTDKNQATEIAIEFERIERRAMAGTLTSNQIKKICNDVSQKVTGDTIIAPATDVYLYEWLKGVRERSKPSTFERYNTSVNLFLANLGVKAKKPISSISSREVETFLNSRLAAKVAPKTAIVDLKIINIAFHKAYKFGDIDKNPVAAVRLPKDVSSEREIFTQDEVEKLVRVAPTHEWQTVILLGYFCGARLTDCVQMKWENIQPEQNQLEYEQKKTGKIVPVPLHLNLLEHLNFISTFGTKGFLCPKLAGKATGGRRGLSEGFRRIVVKAGIDPMTVKGKGIRNFTKRSFHSLRHSFNSVLANAGVPEEIRRKMTGHASPMMNQKYTHLETDTLKKAMDSFPVFGSNAK
jgi:integrase